MSRRLLAPLLVGVVMVTAACSSSHPAGAGSPATPASGTAAGGSPAGTTAAGTGTAPGAQSSGTATSLDPCGMLTTDQVTGALGQAPAAGKPTQIFDTPECEWVPASGANGTVTLDVGPWQADPGIKPLRTGTPVAGVGDEAYDGANTGLFVRKGSKGLRIWVFNVHTQSTNLEVEKQLAAAVLAKW